MTTAAGWHTDPGGRHQLRYWDGSAWTEHVSDNGTTSVEALAAPAGPPTPAPAPASGGGGWLDKLSAAAQTATEQSSKWIDENLNSSSGNQPSPGPTAANASPPPTSSSPPPAAASASPPPASAAPPPTSASGQSPSAHPVAGSPGASTGDVADQIRKLGQLRDEGLLTEDEFSAQKAKLLGQ